MTPTDPNTFLWDNICRLLGDPTLSIGKVERALGLSHTTTQRIREGETATRLSTLVQIATASGAISTACAPKSIEVISTDP